MGIQKVKSFSDVDNTSGIAFRKYVYFNALGYLFYPAAAQNNFERARGVTV
jgi:hypothetical protein